METTHIYLTTEQAIEESKKQDGLIPSEFLSTFPNNFGINLCAVKGFNIEMTEDKQYKSITVDFIPKTETIDERIKKEIIQFLQLPHPQFVGKRNHEEWIAWLEKPKYTEEDLDKAYKCADEVQYRRGYEDAKREFEKQGEHQEYPKDVIDNAISFLANRNDGMPEEEAKDIVNAIITVLNPCYWPKRVEQKPEFCHHEVDLSNCSEEYRKAYYDGWNNCNQQHSQLEAEQKPAWSEEDEEMFDAIIADIQFTQKAHTHEVNQVVYEREIDWIKFLKERMKGNKGMKENEAPEKLYYAPYGDIREDHPITDNDIEYIRTDAFIEKACEWLRKNADNYTWYDEFDGESGMVDGFVEVFRNYMKG